MVGVTALTEQSEMGCGFIRRHMAMLFEPIQSIFEQSGPGCFGMGLPCGRIAARSHGNTRASNDHRATTGDDCAQLGMWICRVLHGNAGLGFLVLGEIFSGLLQEVWL